MRFYPKTIYCEKCSRKLATWDGKSSANIEVKCNKCNIYYIYIPDIEETKVIQNPERTTGSGKRFY